VVKKVFPDHSILGEEEGHEDLSSNYRWIIDPLDGTTNFINGIPIFAVSIALEKDGDMLTAAVYNPVTDSLFYAEKTKGSFWNDEPIRVSNEKEATAMFTIGRSRIPKDIDDALTLYTSLRTPLKYGRILGSAALEMAYLARGGTEGYINLGTKLWDYAAGTLLIEEAGGVISDLQGKPWTKNEQYFVASNGKIHQTLLKEIQKLPQVVSDDTT